MVPSLQPRFLSSQLLRLHSSRLATRHPLHCRATRSLHTQPTSTDTEPHILLRTHELDDATDSVISVITLNRVSVANAMGHQMLSEFTNACRQLARDKESRCVLLTSASTKVFSAGADLKERRLMNLQETALFVRSLRTAFQSLANLPQPVIAAVEGVALGGGLELALAADIRIVGANSTFGLPENTLAIVPGAGGTQRLPRLIGMSRAKELIWTGRRIDAATALEYGMVDRVTEPGAAYDGAIELATEIAKSGPMAVRASKQAIHQGMSQNAMSDALNCEGRAYAKTLETVDRVEGLEAFKEKRKPKYKGL